VQLISAGPRSDWSQIGVLLDDIHFAAEPNTIVACFLNNESVFFDVTVGFVGILSKSPDWCLDASGDRDF
jgi:hypothetical protein